MSLGSLQVVNFLLLNLQADLQLLLLLIQSLHLLVDDFVRLEVADLFWSQTFQHKITDRTVDQLVDLVEPVTVL